MRSMLTGWNSIWYLASPSDTCSHASNLWYVRILIQKNETLPRLVKSLSFLWSVGLPREQFQILRLESSNFRSTTETKLEQGTWNSWDSRHLKRSRGSYSRITFCAWEICRHDGCHVCSLWTTNATVIRLQSKFWCCLSAIRRNFCVVSWSPMKHGSAGTPEEKEQWKHWTSSSECAPKKTKTVLSAGNVMVTVFWNSQGVIWIDSESRSGIW